MIWESGTKSLRQIDELFGGLDYAAVAQRIRRTRSAHTARARSNLITEMLKCLDVTPFPPFSFAHEPISFLRFIRFSLLCVEQKAQNPRI